ncbi:type II secretion system protein M [bacterium]|nr:type II secretion system protein M [bacterium]MBU1752576.1 type II secretion system protein M [bacterium]
MKEIIQNKTILKASGIILIIFLMLMLWKYEMDQYAGINREIKQATAKLENYKDCLQNAEFYTQQWQRIQKTLSQVELRCYQNKTPSLSTTCLLEDVQRIIGANGNSIIRIEVLPVKEMDSKYVQIGVNLKLKTSSQGLTDILYRLKNNDKLYQINQLSVFVASDGWLEVEIRVTAVHIKV